MLSIELSNREQRRSALPLTRGPTENDTLGFFATVGSSEVRLPTVQRVARAHGLEVYDELRVKQKTIFPGLQMKKDPGASA
jgi:hypothetical protein